MKASGLDQINYRINKTRYLQTTFNKSQPVLYYGLVGKGYMHAYSGLTLGLVRNKKLRPISNVHITCFLTNKTN